jgi:hypothetical protein
VTWREKWEALNIPAPHDIHPFQNFSGGSHCVKQLLLQQRPSSINIPHCSILAQDTMDAPILKEQQPSLQTMHNAPTADNMSKETPQIDCFIISPPVPPFIVCPTIH